MGFPEDIAKFATKAKGNGDLLVRKTVLDIGTRLVNRTPVGDASYWKSKPPAGYAGGHAKANWSHSEGALKPREFEGVDKTGSVSNNRILSSVPKKAAGKVHFIQNSVPYIERLEDGWSRQTPPGGMVALTATEFQGLVNGIARGLK